MDEKTRLEIKDGILRFIARLRAVNKKVFILETGGLPQPRVYPGTNTVLTPFLLQDEIQALVNMAPKVLAARINTINYFCDEAFVEAYLVNPLQKT